MARDFERQMYYIMKHYPTANEILKNIKSCGDTLLLGGALREFKDNNLRKMPRDFDIVVDTNETTLFSALAQYSPKINRFGGYKIDYKDLVIDVWCLKDTWAFKEKIIKCDPKDYSSRLQDTVFLNIDSIVYNMSRDIWYDDKYEEAIRTRVLDIVLKENPQLSLNILRTIVFKRKYSMELSSRLKEILCEFINTSKQIVNQLMEIQLSHYHSLIFNNLELMREIKSICKTK